MVKFPKLSILSYSEMLSPIIDINNRDEAEEYLKDYISFILSKDYYSAKNYNSALDFVKSNIGFFIKKYPNKFEKLKNLFNLSEKHYTI